MRLKRIISSSIAALLCLMFIMRGPVLRSYVSHRARTLEKNHNIIIHFDKLKIKAVSTVNITNLRISQGEREPLICVNHLSLKVSAMKMLTFTPALKRMEADSITISFMKRDSISNFDFLFSGKRYALSESDTVRSGINKDENYSRQIERFTKLIPSILPSDAYLGSIEIDYINNDYSVLISSDKINVVKGSFNARVRTKENNVERMLNIDCLAVDKNSTVTARIYSPQGRFSVPFINYRWGAEAEFDTLAFELNKPAKNSDVLTLTGSARAKEITVYHNKLSSEPVRLEKGLLQYKINIGANFFELDSTSVVTINDLSVSPYIKAQHNERWRFTASLNKTGFPAQTLFASLPKGLFYNLEGIRTSGNFSYHLFFDLDLSNIDSLKLESKLTPEDFRITSFGNTDFRKINEEFEYTVYEKGVPVKSFMVGPSNKNFRSLDKISPLLQMTVLQSEDGGFFYHHGFLPESIREALIQDIKEKRFHRGGSTISMQLVKNLFLNRNKTLTRKFEEIMIVWLIEKTHLSSKERMFEVYLNIIEWGPGVYGVNEASRFYFDKNAKELNANEAIFLSGIIPAPKWALNSFTDDMELKPQMEGYFRLLAERLRIKGVITEAEEAEIKPQVHLRGEARNLIKERALKMNYQTEREQ